MLNTVDIRRINGAGPSGEIPSQEKLDLRDIFSYIGNFVCQVDTGRGKCSGVLLGEKRVLVPVHATPVNNLTDSNGNNLGPYVFPVTIFYQDISYTAYFLKSQNQEIAKYYDFCLFEVFDDDFMPIKPPRKCENTPLPGDKIYFAGYPLTQTTPSFHKGIISSVDETGDTVCFHIDAPVLPGSSGSPVFIKREENLFLIGIVFGELAVIDKGFKRQHEILRVPSDLGFVSGRKTDHDRQFIVSVIDTVFANLSTGIGKVLSIKHVKELTLSDAQIPPDPSPSHFGFLTSGGERMPGHLATDLVYRDWWHHVKHNNHRLCMEVLGKIYGAADNIDNNDEKKLYKHYKDNVKNDPQKGHKGYQKTPEGNYIILKSKIDGAKPKAIEKNSKHWIEKLSEYKKDLPNLSQEIQSLITNLQNQ